MVLSEQSHYAQKVQSNNMDYRNDYSAAKAMSDSISAMENSCMIGNTTANDAVCNDEVDINKENRMDKENTKSAGVSHPAANMANLGKNITNRDEMSAKITALNHLNKIVGFDAHNSSGYIIRLIVDKGERARLLDEINICQNLLKECFENGCIDEGLRLNGVINHACGILATATNYNGVQVA